MEKTTFSGVLKWVLELEDMPEMDERVCEDIDLFPSFEDSGLKLEGLDELPEEFMDKAESLYIYMKNKLSASFIEHLETYSEARLDYETLSYIILLFHENQNGLFCKDELINIIKVIGLSGLDNIYYDIIDFYNNHLDLPILKANKPVFINFRLLSTLINDIYDKSKDKSEYNKLMDSYVGIYNKSKSTLIDDGELKRLLMNDDLESFGRRIDIDLIRNEKARNLLRLIYATTVDIEEILNIKLGDK